MLSKILEKKLNKGKSRYSKEQAAAIIKSIEIGELIKKDHPEVKDMLNNGNLLCDIVSKLKIEQEYNINYEVAHSSVYYALKGYKGNSKFVKYPKYDGLMFPEEYYSQIKKNMSNFAKTRYNKGIGIGGLSPEELRKCGKNGGKIGGEISGKQHKKNHTGICGLTLEQRRKNSRVGVINRGEVPYTNEEKKYLLTNYREPKYKKGKKRINCKRLAQDINNDIHNGKNIRTSTAISLFLASHDQREDRGFVLYSDREIRYILNQSEKEMNYIKKGTNKGKPNWKKILKIINNKFHSGIDVRSNRDLANIKWKYKTLDNYLLLKE